MDHIRVVDSWIHFSFNCVLWLVSAVLELGYFPASQFADERSHGNHREKDLTFWGLQDHVQTDAPS